MTEDKGRLSEEIGPPTRKNGPLPWMNGRFFDAKDAPSGGSGRPTTERCPVTENKGPLLDEKGRVTRDKGPLLDEKGRVTRNKGPLLDEKGRATRDKGPLLDEKGRLPEGDAPSALNKVRMARVRGRGVDHDVGARVVAPRLALDVLCELVDKPRARCEDHARRALPGDHAGPPRSRRRDA